MSARRNVGASWRNFGASDPRKPRREHVRYLFFFQTENVFKQLKSEWEIN